MKRCLHGEIEGVALRARHDPAARRRGDRTAGGFARPRRLGMHDAPHGVLDRPVAGAAAEVALQRARQIVELLWGEAGDRRDHARGAEAALEPLRVQEPLLDGRQRPVGRGEALDGGDFAALGAHGRKDAAVHRAPVDMDGAGPAVARVAALLDAEPAELAQEGAQALAGPRPRVEKRSVHRDAHARRSARISSASMKVSMRRQSERP